MVPPGRTSRVGEQNVAALAELHVTCWHETYTGLVPAEEIARHDRALRLRQ